MKYRPAGGFCVFALNDPAPVVSWSVLDHERVPKLGVRGAAGARALPSIVVADRPPEVVAPGESLSLDVHVVNDLRHSIDDAVVDVTASWAGGSRRWRFGGDHRPRRVHPGRGDLMDVPDTLGALTFDLILVRRRPDPDQPLLDRRHPRS